jgi:hypothetical protein
METISLLWTIVSIVGTGIITVLGGVAGTAWWFKGQLTSSELAGVKAENAALKEQAKLHEGYRQWAEAQTKVVTEQLTAAQATIQTLKKEIAEGAKKEVLAATAESTSREISTAYFSVKALTGPTGPFHRPDNHPVFGTTDHRPLGPSGPSGSVTTLPSG